MADFAGLSFNFSKKKPQNGNGERRSSPENPSTSLANPDTWLLNLFGASENGVTVNYETALGIPAYWAAVKRRAGTIASLQIGVWKKTKLGSERSEEHPLDYLLSAQPHPLYNSFIFFQTLITCMDVYGNGYARIERDDVGGVARFHIVRPPEVREIIQEKLSNDYFYIIDINEFGQQKSLPVKVEDMIHLRGLTLTGLMALDPVKTQRETFRAALSNSAYESNFYENGAHVNYALEVPSNFSPTMKETFFTQWRKVFSGVANAFKRPLIIDGGAKLHQLKMTPADAAMVEAKKAKTIDMARIQDVPLHMIGAGENQTFASVEVMMTDFVQYSIRNTVKQLENEFNNKAFSPKDLKSGKYFIRINMDSLLRGDAKARTEKLESEVKWGIITRNEAREMAGYNKMEGSETYMTPANMNVMSATGEMMIKAGTQKSEADSN